MNSKHAVSVEENGIRRPVALFSRQQDARAWAEQFASSGNSTAKVDLVQANVRSEYDSDRFDVPNMSNGRNCPLSLRLDGEVGWKWRKAWRNRVDRDRDKGAGPRAVGWVTGHTYESAEMAPVSEMYRLRHAQWLGDGEAVFATSWVSGAHVREILGSVAVDRIAGRGIEFV